MGLKIIIKITIKLSKMKTILLDVLGGEIPQKEVMVPKEIVEQILKEYIYKDRPELEGIELRFKLEEMSDMSFTIMKYKRPKDISVVDIVKPYEEYHSKEISKYEQKEREKQYAEENPAKYKEGQFVNGLKILTAWPYEYATVDHSRLVQDTGGFKFGWFYTVIGPGWGETMQYTEEEIKLYRKENYDRK